MVQAGLIIECCIKHANFSLPNFNFSRGLHDMIDMSYASFLTLTYSKAALLYVDDDSDNKISLTSVIWMNLFMRSPQSEDGDP